MSLSRARISVYWSGHSRKKMTTAADWVDWTAPLALSPPTATAIILWKQNLMFYTQTGNIYQVKEWKIPYCSDLSDDTCNKLSDCLFYYYLRPKRKFFFLCRVLGCTRIRGTLVYPSLAGGNKRPKDGVFLLLQKNHPTESPAFLRSGGVHTRSSLSSHEKSGGE